MIYKNLNTDEITQLEFQAGKKATQIIDGLLSANAELTETIEALGERVKALEDAQESTKSEDEEI